MIVALILLAAAAVPATGDSERVDITHIPMWMNGDFRIGSEGRGHVRRLAAGKAQRHEYSQHPRVEDSTQDRRGNVLFSASGPDVGGMLEGDCTYSRAEQRTRVGAITASRPTVPLLYHCDFRLDGRPAGALDLKAAPPHGRVPTASREGLVRFAGSELGLRSIHTLPGAKWPVEQALGYEMTARGQVVGMIDKNGGTRARMMIPRPQGEHAAAMAAGIALALFWDPGDTDD